MIISTSNKPIIKQKWPGTANVHIQILIVETISEVYLTNIKLYLIRNPSSI